MKGKLEGTRRNGEFGMRDVTEPWFNGELQNNEYRTAEFRRVVSLCSVFYGIDRMHKKNESQ